jgi:hypothetical protein
VAYGGIVNIDRDKHGFGRISTLGQRFENGRNDLARTTPFCVEIDADECVTGLLEGALEFGKALDCLGHRYVLYCAWSEPYYGIPTARVEIDAGDCTSRRSVISVW